MPRFEQDVLGLDIAVHDVLVVRVGQRIGDVPRDRHRVGDRQAPLANQPVAQALTRDVRHRVKQEAAGDPGVEQRQDVRVGEAGGDLDLAQKAFRSQ